jgi:hypothetical protein
MFSYGRVIQDEAHSDCGLSLVQASFIYVLMPGLAGRLCSVCLARGELFAKRLLYSIVRRR